MTHHLISVPLADLNTGFFFLKVHCIAPRWLTFQGVSRKVDVISIRDFANSIDVFV